MKCATSYIDNRTRNQGNEHGQGPTAQQSRAEETKSGEEQDSGRGGKLTDASKQIKHTNDFDLITWLVIKDESNAAEH